MRSRRALMLVAMLANADVGAAQQLVPRRSVCLDGIPATAMKRVPVYAAAEIADGDVVSASVIMSIDLFTQVVAEQARTLLGAGPGQLPPGEPSVTWRQLDHRLRVIAHRDGRLAWRVDLPSWLSDGSLGDSGVRHLGVAIDAARRNGESFLWDDGLARDSIAWVVRLEPATFGEDGAVAPPALRSGFPVFTVLAPSTLAAEVGRLRTNFPMVRVRGFSGTVRLQFVIDTAGRADPATIRSVWPPNEPRLAGPPSFAYDSVVRVMLGAVKDARFAPARVGSCIVHQLVQQAFTYQPAR